MEEQNKEEKPKKPRKTRSDKGKRLLTARDIWLLCWIAQQYAIRFDQLQQLISRKPLHRKKDKAPGPGGVTDSDVDQILARWQEEPAWVVYDRIYKGAPGWIWLTPYCIDLLHSLGHLPKYSRHNLRESRLSHRYYINRVRLDYEARHPDYTWISERTLLSQLPRRAEGEDVPHVPDAEVLIPPKKQPGPMRVVAAEIELSPKKDEEIDQILAELLAGEQPRYRRVWYFVSDADPVYVQAWRVVEDAVKRLPERLQSRVDIVQIEKVGANDAAATAATPDSEQAARA